MHELSLNQAANKDESLLSLLLVLISVSVYTTAAILICV